MNRAWERQEAGIMRAIRKSGAAVAQPARGRWELTLSNGQAYGVSGILDAEWLLLESAPARATHIPRAAELLRANALLSGLAKFSDPAHGRRASIQAEIPTGDGIDLAARLRETFRGFSSAHAIATGKPMPFEEEIGASEDGGGFGKDAADGKASDIRRAIVAALRKVDWPFRERDDGSIAVDLESDRGYHQARLEVCPSGGLAASVEVADWRDSSASSREAAARLLLAANNGVRMARAVAVEEDERWSGRFEIRLEGKPSEAELRHILAALSVACRHWARELRSLQQESTARAFLAVLAVRS